ncbi:hypothetical protein [Sphaerospermopsis sp. FACHB-1194]|jgi:hypothetical protein|uniref:hypothetical protein n=1 Tax=Sphaerospermopsis sp. FACHB-1194 TaxID=2692862 RepID=UPI001681405A|nr:hypothetical protein [Sphaerospermopsis sp. FACHB-1194]MBD2145528.1 hypothetical protein [Sphaerospermopsis sp. FACHB-1194]
MSNQINPKKSELFQELSEQEQELAHGGSHSPVGMLFYQETDTLSYANNEIEFSDGEGTFDNSQTTFYKSTERTLWFIPLVIDDSSGERNRSLNGILSLLFRLFS